MSVLLLNAKTKIKAVDLTIDYLEDTQFNFSSEICFNIQQILEFTIKYVLEVKCVEYRRSHDIEYLFDLLSSVCELSDVAIQLRNVANKITKWETSSRCDEGFIAEPYTIRETYNLVKMFYQEVSSKYATPTIKYTEQQIRWCRINAPDSIKHLSNDELWDVMSDSYYRLLTMYNYCTSFIYKDVLLGPVMVSTGL